MRKTSFRVSAKASMSLVSMLRRRAKRLRPTAAARAAGFQGQDPHIVHRDDTMALLLESPDPDSVLSNIPRLQAQETVEKLSGEILSAQMNLDTVSALLKMPQVARLQSKKCSVPHLTAALPDVCVQPVGGGSRQVAETGKGVLIGIIDSGFDLSHPMFRDQAQKLRVAGLLDQLDKPREFTTAQLEAAWAAGTGPGADQHGHGTHVASIAGGSPFNGWEGIAPEARFLLVRTDFLNTANAVQWIFDKARNTPCVINMSFGHHWGAHDGTDIEERLHRTLIRPGRLIVVSAGNERSDNIHIGGRFSQGQTETVTFDVLRQRDGSTPFAALTLWYDRQDAFDITLLTPTGQPLSAPALGTTDQYETSSLDLEIGRKFYSWSNLVQVQIVLSFSNLRVANKALRHWQLRLTCRKAVLGRLDGWINNAGMAEFRAHPLVEQSRTVGLVGTGDGCLAVASHVSKSTWHSDGGSEQDSHVLVGRSSPFSSQGPTRDGRLKPEISAPGQYITAALGDRSELAGVDERALVNERLLTMEGTSMAAPVVAGVVALLLQKKRTLTVAKVRDILQASARHDAHTGPAPWNPVYGYGKLDVMAALAQT